MTSRRGSLSIGVIGHSICSTLGDVYGKKGTMWTPDKEIFCVSDTVRIHLINIAIDHWCRSPSKHAVRYISHCDVIIYVITAERWDWQRARSMRRYFEIGHVFGVKHFVVAIDRMGSPSVSYSKQIFDEMKERVKENLDKTNVENYCILPIGSWCSQATERENIVTKSKNMEWYDGPTLKEISDDIKPIRNDNGSGQLSVTFINRKRGIIVGKMVCGKLSVGDHITTFPAGKKAQIQSIGRHFERVNEAVCGDVIGIKLKGADQNCRESLCRGDLIQFDENPLIEDESIETFVRFSTIIHIQRWSHRTQDGGKRVTELCKKRDRADIMAGYYGQDTFTLLSRNRRVQCAIHSIEWRQDGIQRVKRPGRDESSLSTLQQSDTAKVVLDVESPIFIKSFQQNAKFDAFILTNNGPRDVMTHFGFGKVVDILLSENDLIIQDDLAITKVDYKHFAVTYCNHIERNLSVNTSIAEEIIQIIGAYCGPKIVYQRDAWKDSWEVVSEVEEKDIVKVVNDGNSYLFLERNGIIWRGYGNKYTKFNFAAIEYFAERGIEVKDIAVGEGVSYAVDGDGKTYCWKSKQDKVIPSTIQLDATQFQLIFNR